jgi:hypothetical protein
MIDETNERGFGTGGLGRGGLGAGDGAELGVPEQGVEVHREIGGAAPRYSRRLSDKVLIAFHHACDQADFEIADELLRLLETMLTRRPLVPDGNRRRSMESLVAAHERLWHLRHGSPEE